ncbi:hypothetical protein CAPTEDRAFT_126144 [Capitella teleta]|uniref:Serine/threonine/tyrosine-interacting-like protein 1 n=1 Tax=Capitella teleta TaxID=283909 RepID=R7TM04_CAPTE|nr:hypothetical protein CAPTEDRAFT_126144 [Capitella teleta]|eukprot:ELT94562.1 hypothetical protein CAPTEDRAFT_126144 [Capitella teleta]
MVGLDLLEPTDLYNLLNQATKYPFLSDPAYLLLLDARKTDEYNESHIVTAKKAPQNRDDSFKVPQDAELECKTHVIVYDGNTSSLKDKTPAVHCAELMWRMGSRGPVKVLKGGYEAFSAMYPFLRTQKIIYMPRELDCIETLPTEIIPGLLHLGNWRQGNAAYIQKDLKIKGHINCSMTPETFYREEGPSLLQVSVEDSVDADISNFFQAACEFIDSHKEKKNVVLVFSDLGISRSAAIAVAYLIHCNKWTLKESYAHALKCCVTIRPNRSFVEQLSKWEEKILGEKRTDISDPNY